MADEPKRIIKLEKKPNWYLILIYGKVVFCRDGGEEDPDIPFMSGAHLGTNIGGRVNEKAFVFVPDPGAIGWDMLFLYDSTLTPVIADAECPEYLKDYLDAAATLTKAIHNPQDTEG